MLWELGGKLLTAGGVLIDDDHCCCDCCYSYGQRWGRTLKVVLESADCPDLNGLEALPAGGGGFAADDLDCGEQLTDLDLSFTTECDDEIEGECWEKYTIIGGAYTADCGMGFTEWTSPMDGSDGDEFNPFWAKFGPLEWAKAETAYDCAGCCEVGDLFYVILTEVLPS